MAQSPLFRSITTILLSRSIMWWPATVKQGPLKQEKYKTPAILQFTLIKALDGCLWGHYCLHNPEKPARSRMPVTACLTLPSAYRYCLEGGPSWEEEPNVCPSGREAARCIQSHECTQGTRNWEWTLTVLCALSLILKLCVNPQDGKTSMTPILKMGSPRSTDPLEATMAR